MTAPSGTSDVVVSDLFDHLPCGVVIRSLDGRMLGANRRAREMLGLGIDDLDLSLLDLPGWLVTGAEGRPLPPEQRPAGAAFSKGPIRDFEMSLTRPDGRQLWLRVDSVPFDDPVQGRVSVTSFIDITEQHRTAAALKEQTAKAQEVLGVVGARHRQQQAIADLGRMALEGAGQQELMTRACELVATTLETDRTRVMELVPGERKFILRAGTGWREGLVGSAVIPLDGSQAGYLLDSSEPLVIEDFNSDLRFAVSWLLQEHPAASGIRAVIRGTEHPFGELAAYTVKPRRFTEDDVYFMRAMANTLAEALIRAAASAELERSLEQLRKTAAARRGLLKRLASAVEVERGRIARDVHDDALQSLAALGLRLELLGEKLDRPELKGTLEQIAASLQQSTRRLRQLIFDLRPDALEVGLETAIRFYFEQTQSEVDPRLVVESSLHHEPPPEQRLAIYRACQEAINNVRKHASAERVVVGLDEREGGLEVTITDDGKGFRVAKAPRQGHLGLTAMRERAELLGGSCQISSRPGRGSTVRFWFPIAGEKRPPTGSS